MAYRPDKFSGSYQTLDGPQLWDFLNKRDTITRMETATYLGRPAVEPLSDFLLEEFGERVAQIRVKQMLGHMVRQIMEARGYQLDRSGVPITRAGNIFASGSRYKKTPVKT